MIVDFTGDYTKKLKVEDDLISTDKIEEAQAYYYLYEYTDDLQVITATFQYPTLLNYVKTGLLTEDEMLEALLHK